MADLTATHNARRWGVATSNVARLAATRRLASQVQLGRSLGVSQARVSQIFKLIGANGLALDELDSDGRLALARLYAERHRPEVVAEELWFDLDPQYEQVERAVRAATSDRIDVVVSADLGPDLLAPWRAPTLTVLYTSHDLDLEPVGFVKAMARGEASLITRYVSDRSLLEVWPEPNRRDLPLAHPLQQFWDLYDLGGSDRREAADRLISRVSDDDSVGAMG